MSVVIDARAYYDLSDEDRAVLGGATIYPLAVRLCLGVVSNWLHDLGGQYSIAFVLDRLGGLPNSLLNLLLVAVR